MDSAPPLRRKTYEYLKRMAPLFMETPQVAMEIGLPTNTVRRHLEDLVANGLVKCVPAETHGGPDVWQALV
jgi:predicted ArsR family transcriptional regulator